MNWNTRSYFSAWYRTIREIMQQQNWIWIKNIG